LLPYLEIDACAWIGALPAEFRVLRVCAIRETENTTVHIDHFLLLSFSPLNVNAEWRGTADGPIFLRYSQDWEIVGSLGHEEIVITGFNLTVKLGVLSSGLICGFHDNKSMLVILCWHYPETYLNFREAVSDLVSIGEHFADHGNDLGRSNVTL
jgi:hypothetical protein